MLQTHTLVDRQEKIRCVSGWAKDDDGGGAPFHEMPYFNDVESALAWAREARANPKRYRYIKVDIEYDVRETRRDANGRENKCYYQRSERPYEYNAAIEDDALFYERLKQYGQIVEGDWVVIRDRKIVAHTRSESDAWRAAAHSTQRALVCRVGEESAGDERDIGQIVRRAAQFERQAAGQ
jgi:hypothetical protein